MVDPSEGTFRTISNPYIVGNPIEDDRLFFGRQDDFQYIEHKVSGARTGGLIVLCGSRRSGKTSILFQINGGRLGPDFVPVLVDMQAITVADDREFVARLVREIIDGIDDPRLTFAEDFPLTPETNPFALFHHFIRKVNEVLGSRRLILMFDEYELFETKIDKGNFSSDVLNLLGNWMEATAGVYIVFTGSDRIEERNPRYWQAFMGKALHRRISFLSRDDTDRLVREPVAGRVTFEDGVPERIYELTAGQPFYTQVIVQSIVDHLNENRRRHVTAEDLQEVVAETIDSPLPQMIFTWTSLTDLEKVALSAIAELLRSDPGFVSAADICGILSDKDTGLAANAVLLNESLERLFYHDLLDKSGTGDTFAFKMDLWRLWIGRMHSIWQVVDELTGNGQTPMAGIEIVADKKGRSPRLGVLMAILAVVAVIAIGQALRPTPAPDPARLYQPAPIDTVHLRVDSEPPGGEILLDGELRGKTPADLRLLGSQPRFLAISKAGYEGVEDSVVFESGERTLDRFYPLQELTGALSITTSPPNASVHVDGEPSGRWTPCVIENLSAARPHRLELELPGYRSEVLPSLSVPPDSTTSIHRELMIQTTYLTVLSNPEGADLYFDGSAAPLGRTPHTLNEIPHGRHRMRLEAPGFRTMELEIEVPAPDNRVFADLVELPSGRVVFTVSPFADEVLVDGDRRWGVVVRDSLDLKPGSYVFEFRRAGREARRFTVDVDTGGRQEVHCELR